MARVRKIYRTPDADKKNYYVIDTNFLASKFLPFSRMTLSTDRIRQPHFQAWWREIDLQLARDRARIFIPDICIAESFKVLAQKFYDPAQKLFRTPSEFNNAKRRLAKFVQVDLRELRKRGRKITCHDISTNRDIIVSVDRFFEPFLKRRINVQLPDLIVLATAKYLIDFYDIPKDLMHIVTSDGRLREGLDYVGELPNAYDPTNAAHHAQKIFT